MKNNNHNYRNNEQDRRILSLETHLSDHCEACSLELAKVKSDVTSVKTDVAWLKKSYWIIASASVGGLAGAIINLLS